MLSALVAATPVCADPPQGKGKGKHDEAHGSNDAAGGATVTLSFGQARQIALDVGATRYKPLPPGIRKNLARGKPLPPGIAKQAAPPAMLARLPAHPGHEWRVIGTDLVLVAIATAVVVEVLSGVFD